MLYLVANALVAALVVSNGAIGPSGGVSPMASAGVTPPPAAVTPIVEDAPQAAPEAAAPAAVAEPPKPKPKPVEREAPPPVLQPGEVALREIIASKKAVFDAHNADVALTKKWLDKTLISKEVRRWQDLPGPAPGVLGGGWDPLGLAETKTHYLVYREAEVKHARLAMLCAVGWPLSELLHGPFAGLTGGHSLLAETSGKAPSVLNGGLGQVDGLFWLLAFGLAAAVEINSLDYQFEGWQSAGKPWTYEPGELNFDPLGLRGKWGKYSASRVPRGSYPVDDTFDLIATCTKNVDKAEMAHGRVAMLAVLGYAVQEFVWGVPVVDQTPIFFATPLYNFIGQILNN